MQAQLSDDHAKIPDDHYPMGTTLREALQGSLLFKGLCGGLLKSFAGVCPRVLRGLCGGPRDFPRVFRGSDPMFVILWNCWRSMLYD